MSKKIVKWSAYAAAAAIAVVALLLFVNQYRGDDVGASSQEEEEPSSQVSKAPESGRRATPARADDSGDGEAEPEDEAGDEPDEPKTEEELREAEEEKKVEAFDGVVDAWMEKEGGEVTMKDMDDFVAAFRSVPDARKEECLHRALNLVSDDHVLLLAGILFDKTADKEHIELVFNDVLNRDESVKKLILPMIYKDKTHPCWADTAWILDVTGETSNKEKEQ